MSYVPAIPLGGYAGWAALKRSASVQKAAFNQQSTVVRQEAYFREKIAGVTTATDLLNDRRLLTVALEAYGLEEDVNNRYFLQRVLEDGTLDNRALAMRLADKRYREFSDAFGFGDFAVPNTKLSNFADKLVARWKERSFEAAVGAVNGNLQIAMNAEREIPALAKLSESADSQWFMIMGQRPLRKIFEVAFGLPTSFGILDIDKQKTILEDKARAQFGEGSVAQFAEPEKMEALIRRFLLQSQIAEGASALSSGSTALVLLSQMTRR